MKTHCQCLLDKLADDDVTSGCKFSVGFTHFLPITIYMYIVTSDFMTCEAKRSVR